MSSIFVTCPANQWRLISTNITFAVINRISVVPNKYLIATVNTGGTAPVGKSVGIEAFKNSKSNSTEIIKHPDPVDIYIWADESQGEINISDGILKSNIIQNVLVDQNNSSTDNLESSNSYTYTGAATSTLGVVGLQWSLKTDQNARVYVEQSPDGTNWDLSYQFNYIASKGGAGETVQATQAYYRLRVVLTGVIDTTYFRLLGILCPVATPLPSALTVDSRVKVESHITSQDDNHVWVTPRNEIIKSNRARLVGEIFDGTNKDPNFWNETTANGGTIVQSGGAITLKTNTTANGKASYVSTKKARFVPGTSQIFLSRTTSDGFFENHLHRIGAYDANDGYFVQAKDLIFSIGYRKNGVETIIDNGNFNGDSGSTFPSSGNVFFAQSIQWTPTSVEWYIDGVLLHRLEGNLFVGTNSLPITIETENFNGATIDHDFTIAEACIIRQGDLVTESIFKHISGDAATLTLKYGAGKLQKIMFNNTLGTMITIYDSITGSGEVIGIITTTIAVLGEWEYNGSFSNGLTLVTEGNGLDATIIYE